MSTLFLIFNHQLTALQQEDARITLGVDIIHAFREASLEMLERAKEKDIFEGSLKIKALVTEDIIGLKLQSVFNNPLREKVDISDIEMLVSIHRESLDRELLKKYFRIFEMEDLYKKIIEGEKE